MSTQPPPIPIKLKPKTLKKLSQQGRGPVYVIVPNPPHPPGGQGPGPSLQHPHQQHQRSSYNSNFTLMPRHHQHVSLVPMPPPLPPPPPAITNASVASGQNGSINSSGSLLLDNHQRFRPEKPSNSRPRVQQLQQWMRHERNSANWIKHLTDDDDDDEETEDVVDHQQRRNGTSNSTNHQRPSSQVQLSSRVASMTIADVSPRFALKVSLFLFILSCLHYVVVCFVCLCSVIRPLMHLERLNNFCKERKNDDIQNQSKDLVIYRCRQGPLTNCDQRGHFLFPFFLLCVAPIENERRLQVS